MKSKKLFSKKNFNKYFEGCKPMTRNRLLKILDEQDNSDNKDLFIEIENYLRKKYTDIYYSYKKDDYIMLYCTFLELNKLEYLHLMKSASDSSEKYQSNFEVPMSIECLIVKFTFSDIFIKINSFKAGCVYYDIREKTYRIPVNNINSGIRFKIDALNNITFLYKKIKFPMNLSAFKYFYKDDVLLWECVGVLLEYFKSKHYFWKDIYTDIEDFKKLNFPKISFSAIFESHNIKELISKSLKIDVPKSFNKAKIDKAFFIAKAAKRMPENERQKLYALLRHDFDLCVNSVNSDCDKINSDEIIFFEYYNMLFNGLDKKYKHIVEDYIHMTVIAKKPIALNVKSVSGIIKKHQEAAMKYRLEHMEDVVLPENSIFNALELPCEFERITSKERLSQEAIENKHCVWSYSNRINNDLCAIYSVVYEDERYTIEIIKDAIKGFFIHQIRGYNNSNCPEELIKKVNNLLKLAKT